MTVSWSAARWLHAALLLSVALFAIGCKKPDPPTVKPEGVVVKSVGPGGLELEVTLDAYNPNDITLTAQKVKARVKLDGTLDLGEVVVPTKVKIKAKKHEKIVAPLSLKWGDAASVALMAYSKDKVPYTVEGTAVVGGEDINFDVPFETSGELTKEQLKDLGGSALPIPVPTFLPQYMPTAIPF